MRTDECHEERRGKRFGAAVWRQEIAGCIGSGFVARTHPEHPIAAITDQPAGQQIVKAIKAPIAAGKAIATFAEAAINDFIGEQRRAVADAREIGSYWLGIIRAGAGLDALFVLPNIGAGFVEPHD